MSTLQTSNNVLARTYEGGKATRRLSKEIDDLDIQIATLLQDDSRLSYRQIAQRLGISKATAFNRVKKLETTGTLRKYTISIDPLRLGLDLTALVLIQAQGGLLGELEQEIARNDNVLAAYEMTGEYDAAIVAKFRNASELREFAEKLQLLSHVKRTVMTVALEVMKEEYLVPLPSVEEEKNNNMRIESCRDCANFEDRRCIEKVALCEMHHGPSVCCPEFKPGNRTIDENESYDRFCLNCANFDNVNGIAICAKDHRPGIACAAFRERNDSIEIAA